jgi:hypothetical protein
MPEETTAKPRQGSLGLEGLGLPTQEVDDQFLPQTLQPSFKRLRGLRDISDAVFYDMLTDKAVAVLNLANLLESLQWLPEEPYAAEGLSPTDKSGDAAT